MFSLYVPPIYVLYVHVCQKLCHKYITEIKDTPHPPPKKTQKPPKKTPTKQQTPGIVFVYLFVNHILLESCKIKSCTCYNI